MHRSKFMSISPLLAWVWVGSRSWRWTCCHVHGVTKSRARLRDWTELTYWHEDQGSGISSLGKGSSNNCNKSNHCLSLHKSNALHSYSVKVGWAKVTQPDFREKRKPKKIRRAYLPTIQPLQPRRGLGRVHLLWMDSESRSILFTTHVPLHRFI